MKRLWALVYLLDVSAFGQSLAGDWIGGYKQNDKWIVVRVHFEDRAGSQQGTMDIVSPKQRGIPLKDISTQDAAIRFRLAAGPREDEFSGTVSGGSISGSVRGKAGETSK